MKRLEIRAAARRDLEEIRTFSIMRFGEIVASDYLIGLRAAFAQLQSYPQSGELARAIRPLLRVLRYKSHRIYYRVEDTVVVVRILHVARDTRHAVPS